MVIADFIALVLLLGGGASAIAFVRRWWNASDAKEKEAFTAAARALESNDYKKIEDVLALYSGDLNKHIKRHLELRKAELYVGY